MATHCINIHHKFQLKIERSSTILANTTQENQGPGFQVDGGSGRRNDGPEQSSYPTRDNVAETLHGRE